MTAHDEARQQLGSLRTRFQPLLLPAAALVVFPAALSASAPTWVLVLLASAVVLGCTLAVAARTGRLPPRRREQLAIVLTSVGLTGFAVVVLVVDRARPQDFLVVGVALLCALASSPRLPLRSALSLVVFATMAAAMFRGALPLSDVLFGLALLTTSAALAQAVAANLRAARRRALRAYDDARDRADLLETLRGSASSSLAEAAQVSLDALRRMGVDAAALHRIELGELRVVHVNGFDGRVTPPPRGQGLVWRSIEEDRTVVSDDYARDAQEVQGRPDVRSAIAVPLREGATPTGSVAAVWFRPHGPTPREIELVEVLAAHLGGIASAEDRLARQQELLQRLRMLDRMRRELLNAMSGELGEPLTGLRRAVQQLDNDASGQRLTPASRDTLLDEVAERTARLRQLVETVLGFSRSQGNRPDPGVVPVEIGQVLAGLPTPAVVPGLGPRSHDPSVAVVVDPYLLRSGLELLIDAGRLARGPDAEVRAEIDLDDEAVGITLSGMGPMPALVRSLASQLLVAAGARLVQEVEHCTVFVSRVPRAERPIDASTARGGFGVGVVTDVSDA